MLRETKIGLWAEFCSRLRQNVENETDIGTAVEKTAEKAGVSIWLSERGKMPPDGHQDLDKKDLMFDGEVRMRAGSNVPHNVEAGAVWIDTTYADHYLLKVYDGIRWNTEATLDPLGMSKPAFADDDEDDAPERAPVGTHQVILGGANVIVEREGNETTINFCPGAGTIRTASLMDRAVTRHKLAAHGTPGEGKVLTLNGHLELAWATLEVGADGHVTFTFDEGAD